MLLFGALFGGSGFIAGVVSSRLHAGWRHEHDVQHVEETKERDADLKAIRSALEAIKNNMEMEAALTRDAIAAILIEGKQSDPALGFSIETRYPHVWDFFARREHELPKG